MHLEFTGLSDTLPDEFGLYFPALRVYLLSGNYVPVLEVLSLAGNKQFTMNFIALLELLQPLYGSLRILNISDCNFHSTILKELWDFQSLTSVDLSNNRLSGQLPSPTAQDLVFPTDVNVSGNNLSGQIPQTSWISLKVLDFSKNPFMHETDERGPLPSFMEVDYTTLTPRNPSDKFTCPNVRLNYNNGLTSLDPSYYRYRLCICDIGYYGSRKTCLPCMEGATCEDQTPPARNMVMNIGYWPSSRDQNVTHLVKCSRVLGTSPQENTPCNPTGTCDCDIEWLHEGNKSAVRPSTVCNELCLCLKDRFCSLCEDVYYKQGIFCYACPKTRTRVYILGAVVVLTMVFLTLAFTVL